MALPTRLASTKLPQELVGQAIQAWDILNFFISKVATDNIKEPACSWEDFEEMLVNPHEAVQNSHIHRFHTVVLEMLLAEVRGDGKDAKQSAFDKMPVTCYTWPILLHKYLEKIAVHEILNNRDAETFTNIADLLATEDYEEFSLENRVFLLQTMAELAMAAKVVRRHFDSSDQAQVDLQAQKKHDIRERLRAKLEARKQQ